MPRNCFSLAQNRSMMFVFLQRKKLIFFGLKIVLFWRNDRNAFLFFKLFDEWVCVISLVSDERVRIGFIQKRLCFGDPALWLGGSASDGFALADARVFTANPPKMRSA